MTITKQNLPLYLAIALPIILILVIVLAIYLPNRLAHPRYDFIYSQTMPGIPSSDYTGYTVINSKLQITPIPAYALPSGLSENTPKGAGLAPQPAILSLNVKLYYYNTNQNSSHEITFDQAQTYTLNSDPISPDNFQVQYGSYGGDVPFSAPDYSRVFLVGHGAHRQLQTNEQNNYDSFNFLGWVTK